ncbi:hypothetical protein [uncultured Jatrophihabitans sp.]|uniref:hypothetical protein n=1 Tax=uncultured Jatrophihabitans sp. TaxID=1610747 RepID=UPI0035C9747D
MDEEEAKQLQAELLAKFKTLPKEQQRSLHAEQVPAMNDTPLTIVDATTKRRIWVGIFGILGLALIGALLLILRSYSIDLKTTTGAGNSAVTAITHPDVSAAWALAAAVVSGVVGLLAPTPVGSKSDS